MARTPYGRGVTLPPQGETSRANWSNTAPATGAPSRRARGKEFLQSQPPESSDLIFADRGPRKFPDLDLALSLLRRGAIYIADNMFLHLFHPPDRAAKLREFRRVLGARKDLVVTKISWASGVSSALPEGD